MPSPAEMRVREPDDLLVVVLITGAILVRVLVVNAAHVMGLLVGVRRKLHRSERHGRTGEGVPHLLCPDQRIYVLNVIARGLRKDLDVQEAHEGCDDDSEKI